MADVFDLSMDDVNKASAMLADPADTTTAEPVAAEPAAVAAEPIATATEPVAAPAAAVAAAAKSAIQLADDAEVEFEWGGKPVKLTGKELKTERMLHADYSRKRAADAQAVRDWQTQRDAEASDFTKKQADFQQAVADFQAIARDPQKLAILYQAVAQNGAQAPANGQPAASAAAPGQTFDPKALEQQTLSAVSKLLAERDDKASREAFAAQTERSFAQVADTTVANHPLLKSGGANEVNMVWSMVAEMVTKQGAEGAAEARDLFPIAAQARETYLQGLVDGALKLGAAGKAKLPTTPRGGTGVVPAPPDLSKVRMDSDEFIEMVAKHANTLEAASR